MSSKVYFCYENHTEMNAVGDLTCEKADTQILSTG